MALDQSALAELLDALRSGGDDLDFMREAMQLVSKSQVSRICAELVAEYEVTHGEYLSGSCLLNGSGTLPDGRRQSNSTR